MGVLPGASRGIGAEIARLFAAEGASCVLAARTISEGDHKTLSGSLETTLSDIKEAGGEATAVVLDVGVYDSCASCMEEVHRIYGPIDILVVRAPPRPAATAFTPLPCRTARLRPWWPRSASLC